jgi:hypothetical protein
MRFAVQTQHRLPEPVLWGWTLDHAGPQRIAVVHKTMV